jgi:glyoxylase-like metal-dependent hydrolase (beta-lactamase superfamily II)
VREVIAGVFHWLAIHPRIHVEVSSYWLEDGGVLIDPLLPADVGLAWFEQRKRPPAAILLSNRHHYRDSGRFQSAFGCAVYCNRAGLHEFTHGEPVTAFDPGDTLPGGVVAHEVGGLCPDETALQLPARRALVFADAVVRGGSHGQTGPLGFVPDALMDDPSPTKRQLLEAFARLLGELDFEHLLLAHGGPVIGNGRAQLQELVERGGRTAFEL